MAAGDALSLALLEARPVAGVLRFYVADYVALSSAASSAISSRPSVDSDGAIVWEEEEQSTTSSSPHGSVGDHLGQGEDTVVPSIEELFALAEAEEAARASAAAAKGTPADAVAARE